MLTRFLTRFLNLVILSVLWFLCSIPLLTVGASTAAMYAVTLRMASEGDDNGIISTFFSAFKNLFRKATCVFLVLLAFGLFLLADLWCAIQWKVSFRMVLIVMILAVGWFWLVVFTHAFAGLAWFEGKPLEVVKRTFLLAMRNGIFTVFIIMLNLIPPVFLFRRVLSDSFGQWLILYIFFGSGTVAFLSSLHLSRLFATSGTMQNYL